MAIWTALKNVVNNIIRTNGNNEITGQLHQDVLNQIINELGEAQFKGVANNFIPPGSPDGVVWYLASEGSYPSYGGLVVGAEIAILLWRDGSWTKHAINKSRLAVNTDPNSSTDATNVAFVENEVRNPGYLTATTTPDTSFTSHDSGQNQLANSSVFSAWRSEVGQPIFRFLKFKYVGFDPNDLPTILRVNLRVGYGGAIFFTEDIDTTGINADVSYEVVIDAGETISPTYGSENLILEVLANGRLSLIGANGIVPNGWTPTLNSQYKTNKSLVVGSWSAVTGGVNNWKWWAEFWVNEVVSDVVLTDFFKAAIFNNLDTNDEKVVLKAVTNPNNLFEMGGSGIEVENTMTGGGWSSETSTFSAWGCPVGSIGSFNTVQFKIRDWGGSPTPTEVRVRIRLNTFSGLVIADKVISNFSTLTDDNDVLTVIFDNAINETSPLWFEYLTNGRVGHFGNSSNSFVASQGAARYLTNTLTSSSFLNILVSGNGERMIEVSFRNGAGEDVFLTSEGVTYFQNALSVVPQADFAPRLNVPPKIWAVVGRKSQIFFRSLIEAIDPYKWNIKVTGTVNGKQYPRYYEFTPTTTGTKTMTIALYDDEDNEMVTADITVEFVASVQQPASMKKILCFGDSLTAGGQWVGETRRMIQDAGGSPSGLNFGNTEFIGTVGSSPTKYEGYGGKTWEWYITPTANADINLTVASHDKNNNDLTSFWQDGNGNSWRLETVESSTVLIFSYDGHSQAPPATGSFTHVSGATNISPIIYTSFSSGAINRFWNYNTNQLDFQNYVSQNGFGTIDIVYSLLTWNGMGPNRSEATDHVTLINHAKTFLNQLKSDFPNVQMKILGIQLPSYNGGLAANYGDADSNYGNYFGLVKTVFGLNLAYKALTEEATYSSWVEFVEVASQFDNENNMPLENRAVNTRSTITEVVGTNGVHPASSGYYQIADVAFRNFVASFLQ